jgi:hypothetical protein
MPAVSFVRTPVFDWTRPPPPPEPGVRTPAPSMETAAREIWRAVKNRVREVLADVDRRPARKPRPDRPRVTRLENDPDRHIRTVKGGKYQARPIDLGERYDLGLFPTKAAARAAILEFWWGKRPSLPKFTKLCHTNAGPRFIALCPDPGRPGHFVRVGTWFDTRKAAGLAAERWVRRRYGDRAADVLRRKG